MTSQGWAPGQYLGPQDASHAEFHTSANASHIRVAIKDNNLGLGAKIGSGVGHGECTGLDAFKNLLGRLNGADEDELEREQKSRDNLRRAIYTERKWGSQRFVSAGFLVGDKIQGLIDGEVERLRKLREGETSDSSSSDSSSDEEIVAAPVEESKKSKKRKREEIVEDVRPEVFAVKVEKSRKRKEKKVSKTDNAKESAKDLKKKSKKDRRSKAEPQEEQDDAERARKREKKSKKDRKEAKEKSMSDLEDPVKDAKKKKKSKREKDRSKDDSRSLASSQSTTKESTPVISPTTASSGTSTPIMRGRNVIRSRNIAQKRLAGMDVESLNQVCTSYALLCLKITNHPLDLHDQVTMIDH